MSEVFNLPQIRDRAPADAARGLAKTIRTCPVITQADCRPDSDALAVFARAVEEPAPVKALFPPDLGSDGGLHYFDGGVLGSCHQIMTPPIRILTLYCLLVSNVRDEESSDYSGTGSDIGALPFPPAVQGSKDSSVLELRSEGPRALDRPRERQKWTVRQVTSSAANRTIATVVTEGQRRPIETALMRILDNRGQCLAHGITPIDGHGRAGMKFHALVQFSAALRLPFSLYDFTLLEKDEQERIIDTLTPCLRQARDQLYAAKDAKGTIDIEVSYRGVRTVTVPADKALAAVHSWTTTAQVVIGARYVGEGVPDYAASLTRRYETVHNDPAQLPPGASVARVAQHALDRLADAGVFDRVPVYGRKIVDFVKMPSTRPTDMELEYLALMAVWAFSRSSAAAKDVYDDLGMGNTSPNTRAGKLRSNVVAHLVHRSLPRAKKEYHAAAAQSLLVGSSALSPEPGWRPISEVLDTVTANPGTVIGRQALAEARIRTVIAATAAGVLLAAYGSQEVTRARGQASSFVNRMVTSKTTALSAWGRRQAEAIVDTYWESSGTQEPPQVSQDTPAPGIRYVPVLSSTGEIVPVTDQSVRKAWKPGKVEGPPDNSDLELRISESVSDTKAAIDVYAKHLGESGTCGQAWKAVVSTQVFSVVTSLGNLKDQ
ncbi:hypothetical protein [Streptomyces sp. bgisy126]|uniref:hypothetical protein n=1 Tax=unclassified Streptomyces TaxID=2593676 RepID=UPI003EBCAED6